MKLHLLQPIIFHDANGDHRLDIQEKKQRSERPGSGNRMGGRGGQNGNGRGGNRRGGGNRGGKPPTSDHNLQPSALVL